MNVKKIFAIVSSFLLIGLIESCEKIDVTNDVISNNLQENKTDENIIRPNAPNILKYITEEELATLEHKLPNHIKTQGLYDYAINNDSTVDVMVVFYGNVTFDEAKQTASKYGVIIDDYFKFNWLIVRIPQENFWKLAKENNVKRIREESPPPIVLDQSESEETY